MKRLMMTINNLGVNSTGVEFVDFNIWQGKRHLLFDRISGKWSGEFVKAYDVDYDQEHPEQLRIESNASLGVGVSLSIEPNECQKALSQQFGGAIESGTIDSAVIKRVVIKTRQFPIEQVAL